MFHHIEKRFPFPDGQVQRYRLNVLLALLSFALIASGCNSTPLELYENPEFGISLEKPGHWSLESYERNGSIVLVAAKGVRHKDSARIEIDGYACVPPPTSSPTPDEALAAHIERIGILYSLDSVTIVQEPSTVETGDKEVTKAIIAVPTTSLTDDPARNQVGAQAPDLFQIIEMMLIRDRNKNSVITYLYKGISEELNSEAETIIDSIQFICATEP